MQKKAFVILFVTMFLIMLGVGIIIPHLNYFAEEMGATPFQLGLLIALHPAVQFFFSPLCGRWSDQIGRRPVMLTGLIGNTMALLGFGFSRSLMHLFLARTFWGLAAASLLPTVHAYVADITDEKYRGQGMGLIGAAVGLGFVCGPAIGAIFGDLHHWSFITAGIVSGLNTLFVLLFLSEPINRNEASADQLNLSPLTMFTHPLVPLFLVTFVSSFAFAGIETIFPLFIKHRWGYGTREIAIIFVVAGLISVLIHGGAIGKLINRFGEFSLVLVGLLLTVVGLAILPQATGFLTVTAYFCLASIGNIIIRPTNTAWVSKRAKTEQGTAIGLMNSHLSLGRVFGPITSGILYAGLEKPSVASEFLNRFLPASDPIRTDSAHLHLLQLAASVFDLPYIPLAVGLLITTLLLVRPLLKIWES